MKKLLSLSLRCGLAMIGFMLLVQAARAGGAAVPFRQTWRVSWATPSDSVKFDKFLGRGEPAVDEACDVANCVACRVRNVNTSTELAFKDCPLHVADATHQCADFGSWWQQPVEATPANGKHATADFGCAFTKCLHCRAKALGHASASGQVCSHHADNTVHYCHGVTVSTTTFQDMNPSLRFPIIEELQIRSMPSVSASTDHDGAQTLTFDLANEGAQLLGESGNEELKTSAIPTSQGIFEAQFADATQFPIMVSILNDHGTVILEHHAEGSKLGFDLASFPAGVYKLSARNAKGESWVGDIDLQTGYPANFNLNFGY